MTKSKHMTTNRPRVAFKIQNENMNYKTGDMFLKSLMHKSNESQGDLKRLCASQNDISDMNGENWMFGQDALSPTIKQKHGFLLCNNKCNHQYDSKSKPTLHMPTTKPTPTKPSACWSTNNARADFFDLRNKTFVEYFIRLQFVVLLLSITRNTVTACVCSHP